MSKINKLNKQRAILIEYAKMKLDVEDWHGLSDCANDIREIDAKLSVLKSRDLQAPQPLYDWTAANGIIYPPDPIQAAIDRAVEDMQKESEACECGHSKKRHGYRSSLPDPMCLENGCPCTSYRPQQASKPDEYELSEKCLCQHDYDEHSIENGCEHPFEGAQCPCSSFRIDKPADAVPEVDKAYAFDRISETAAAFSDQWPGDIETQWQIICERLREHWEIKRLAEIKKIVT